jgi:hypothetical protein
MLVFAGRIYAKPFGDLSPREAKMRAQNKRKKSNPEAWLMGTAPATTEPRSSCRNSMYDTCLIIIFNANPPSRDNNRQLIIDLSLPRTPLRQWDKSPMEHKSSDRRQTTWDSRWKRRKAESRGPTRPKRFLDHISERSSRETRPPNMGLGEI